ncbi:MAG: hypothetical protein RL272_632 [Candidatus Parcubacteria bacterium]|jgi:hypothetical protein
MSYLAWASGAAWVLALVLQCLRLASKHRPGRDGLYRPLTIAVFAAVAAGCLLQAALGISTGHLVYLRGTAIGIVIFVLLAAVS